MPFSYRPYIRFFIPLSLQAASISFSYPLVSMVASRGFGGTVDLAGFSQSNTVMFLIMMLGAGLGTTGLVFGHDRRGFSQYVRLSYRTAFSIVSLQTLLSLPPFSHLLLGRVMGLPPSIERPALIALAATIPVQFLFLVRNPFQVALLLNKEAGLSSATTMARLGLTALLAPLFVRWELVGVFWASACLTLPVILETILAYYWARPFIKAMPEGIGEPPSLRRLLAFTLPLSLGGIFLALSGMLLGAFMARAGNPERMLPIYYLALSLANPVAGGNLPHQQVVLTFPPAGPRDRSTLFFALGAGAVTGILPMLFLIPPLARWYYVGLQNLPAVDLPLVRDCALILFFYPISVGLRAQGEGIAAHLRRPVIVLTGHAVYLGALVTTAFVMLSLSVPAHWMGAIAIIFANLASTLVLRMSIHWERETHIPVPPTRSSQPHA